MKETRFCILILGWWKTDQNIAQEKRVAELIDAICHSLNNIEKQ